MPLPYIFVLDWDGTIAGKVDFQSHAFTIRSTLKRMGFKTPPITSVPKAFNQHSKLIRPGFAAFMKDIKAYYGNNVYFFIYTASERQWALQEIQWVEKAHDIQFQRPIFTRDDCIVDSSGSYKKSILRVFPRICRSIAKQHQLTKKERDYVLHNQLMVIDNNAVYTDMQDRLLLCPDYNYAVFEHLTDFIPAEARRSPEVQQMIYSFINMGIMCPMSKHDDHMHNILHTYSWMTTKCKHIVEMNKVYAHDDFWKYLRKLITQNELRKYTPSIIKQLQEAVWKRTKKR
jgi:hypothetical protein